MKKSLMFLAGMIVSAGILLTAIKCKRPEESKRIFESLNSVDTSNEVFKDSKCADYHIYSLDGTVVVIDYTSQIIGVISVDSLPNLIKAQPN